MLKTAIVTDRSYLRHFAGRSHPERPERLAAIIDMTEALSRPGLSRYSPRLATRDEIGLCHSPDYIAQVERTASMPRYDFDPDTHSSEQTYHTALLAAGGVLTATEAVLDGAADNAFALVRPPGHHARPMRAMGFCFFNNVAIAARWLIAVRGLKRVMIVDWDVHHGNGTQEIFYESAEVLYVSTHQFPHYPGTGSLHEMGAGDGTGYTVNIPLPAEYGDEEYLRCFDELILPIGRKFNPEIILVSAGFDCHYRDPLADMRVTEDGFVQMARRVKQLAAECARGRMVAALEGGYDIAALVNSVQAVIEELGRDGEDSLATAHGGDRVMPVIERVARGVGSFWGLG